MDRSWPRANSRVWQATHANLTRCFVKISPVPKSFQREVAAYKQAVPALGPDNAPRLIAADPHQLAILTTGLPGSVVSLPDLSVSDQQTVYYKAGQLLRRFHEAVPVPAAEAVRLQSEVQRTAERCEQHIERARALLSADQEMLVRELVADTARVGRLPVGCLHGDFQERNMLWRAAPRHLALIDFERSEPGIAVRDLCRLSPRWFDRPDLRESLLIGYGRNLTDAEQPAFAGFCAADAVSGLGWGAAHGDLRLVNRSRATLAHLMESYSQAL